MFMSDETQTDIHEKIDVAQLADVFATTAHCQMKLHINNSHSMHFFLLLIFSTNI